MGWFDSSSNEAQSYDQYSNADPNQASVSHELLGGAAAYEAAKAYENHCSQNGQPASHAEAKEIAAGFAGAFIDREVETKGMDFIDTERAKRDASQRIDQNFTQDQFQSY